MFSEAVGYPVSRDAVKNRLARIRENAEIEEAVPVVIQNDFIFDVPAQPENAFIGFNTLFWDLETTALNGMMGRILACAFADSFGQTDYVRYDDMAGDSIIDDGPIVRAIKKRLEAADVWVTWNGRLFDVPMLNARLAKAGEAPLRTDIKHIDLMYYARGRFMRIGSSKLENVSKFVNSPNRKIPLDWAVWQMAMVGDREAMDLVVEHAVADVLVTRDVFAVLKDHIRIVHR